MNLEEKTVVGSEIAYSEDWNEDVKAIFNFYLDKCKRKAFLHSYAVVYYKKWYKLTTLPLLIISSMLTATSAYNTTANTNYISIIISILSGVLTAGHSITSFLEYGERANDHLITSNAYSNLQRSIEMELHIPIRDRNSIKFNFEVFSREFASIESSERLIPAHLMKNKKKY